VVKGPMWKCGPGTRGPNNLKTALFQTIKQGLSRSAYFGPSKYAYPTIYLTL